MLLSDDIVGYGNSSAEVMVIWLTANKSQEKAGTFIPDKTTLKYLATCDLTVADCYFTGIIKQAFRGKKPKKVDYDSNMGYLEEEFKSVNPHYVILFGADVTKKVINEKITEVMGNIVEKDGRVYIPCYSPSILFFDANKQVFIDQAFNNLRSAMTGVRQELPELHITILTTKKQVREAVLSLKNKKVAYDIETSGLSRFDETIRLWGFGNRKHQYIIPCDTKYSPLANKPKVQTILVRYAIKLLNKYASKLVAGNGKFDNLFSEVHCNIKPNQTFDVVLASHILNENTPNGVKENAMLMLNAPNWDVDISLKTGNVKSYEHYERYLTYLGYDIYYTDLLEEAQSQELSEDEGLERLYYNLYIPAIKAFEVIEKNGVYIRQKRFKKVEKKLISDIDKQENILLEYADINWQSTEQVGELLFDEMQLPVIERTDNGSPSTKEDVLKQLGEYSPLPLEILKYRKLVKQKNTYIDNWRSALLDSRLYPSFGMTLVTGRTSCQKPNLQQVPQDPFIRSLVGARKGRVFVEIDYSQMELRIASILANEMTMQEIYNKGGDIHTRTYEVISGKKLSTDHNEAKTQRKSAKGVNFGFIYGMMPKTYVEYARLSYELDVSLAEATSYRNSYMRTYNGLEEWHKNVKKTVNRQGYMRSPLGRYRRLPDVYSKDRAKKSQAERQAINSPVQGMGSDILLLAMAEVLQTTDIRWNKYELDLTRFSCMGTVHDAGLFEVDRDYLMEFIPKAKAIFERPKALNKVFGFKSPIPIVADVSIGDSWGEEIELGDNWKKQTRRYLKEGMYE